ncbi:MAG: hypothetical protein J6B89_04765 [Bacilli bacterium]|nr:hypothetical protein [Bacilli bacterium]
MAYDRIQTKSDSAISIPSHIKGKLIYSEKYSQDYRFITELNRLSLLYLKAIA